MQPSRTQGRALWLTHRVTSTSSTRTTASLRIEPSGTLANIHAEDKGGHWLALDARGAFAHVIPKEFQRITPEGAIPALIFANGGAPLVVGADGDLYYGSNGSQQDSFPPGALTVARLSPRARRIC